MIKLLVLDVDGCMTNGAITYNEDGIESKSFNVKDGLGIATWIKMGKEIVIITGRESKIVAKRAKELGIIHLYQGIKDKKTVLENLLNSLEINKNEVAAIGDDLNDFGMLKFVGKSFTPANGMEIIKENVDTVLSKKGGEGAIREMIDIIIKDDDLQEEFINIWL